MAIGIEKVNSIVREYIADVKKVMPIDKAYMYGSYAKGTQKEDSDVDICFFSDAFASKRTIDVLPRLLGLSRKYYMDIDIDPRAFPTSELDNDNPFVKEVLRTGFEITE